MLLPRPGLRPNERRKLTLDLDEKPGDPQAIGISRGGRNSKLHALTDGEGRPIRFLLTGGQVADCRAADVLLDDLAPRTIVLGDKAYDSNAIRNLIERQGAVPTYPPRSTGAGKAASHDRSTEAATRSSACSAV